MLLFAFAILFNYLKSLAKLYKWMFHVEHYQARERPHIPEGIRHYDLSSIRHVCNLAQLLWRFTGDTQVCPQGPIKIEKECELEMNARERLELPTKLMKCYTRTHYITLHYITLHIQISLKE